MFWSLSWISSQNPQKGAKTVVFNNAVVSPYWLKSYERAIFFCTGTPNGKGIYYGEQYLLNNFTVLHNEHLHGENSF